MLSDEIVREMRSLPAWALSEKGGRLLFRCPRHDDRTPSAWMKQGTWGCFACGFKENIVTLATELGIGTEGGDYTLDDYADAKTFPVATLQEWGLATVEERGRKVVRIPYYNTDGAELRARFRARSAKWWEGRNRPIYLYGIDRLADAKAGDAVLVVEGESDCHAAWLHGVKAVGVPGATTWRSEWASHLRDLVVYVWEEPDQGGAQLVASIARDLPDAKIIRDAGVKDVADLHRQAGRDFRARLNALTATATRVGTPKPPVVFDALIGSRFEEILKQKEAPIDAVPTPFPAWSAACCDEGGRRGLARGWHVIAAAKTGTGKSILALNVAARAIRAGERICFISLEMSQVQLETRFLAIIAGSPVRYLEQGPIFDRTAVMNAAMRLREILDTTGGLFYSNREPVHDLAAVLDSMRYNHEVHGARYFIVDYIQLAGNQNDPESIAEISHAVRRLTKDLSVTTFALSQFNRMTSASKDRPTVQGLMGGSALENDADQVLLIDHSRMERARPPEEGWYSWALLDKNRHGPLVEIPIHFDSRTLAMRERLADETLSREVA